MSQPAVIALNEKHSLAIRLWHWITFLSITASLVTVLLGSTLFKTKDNVSVVQNQLQEKGAIVTKDQAWAVAHEFSDKLWDTHKFIGYFLSFLLLSRFLIEIAQPQDEKLKARIKNALGFKTNSPDEIKGQKHYLLVMRGHLVFYLIFLIMALTGLGLAFEDAPVLKDLHKSIKSVHSFVQYFVYGYILLHLIGVVRSDLGKSKGIVSGMINGKP